MAVGFASTHLTSWALHSLRTSIQELKVDIFFPLLDREKNPAVLLWLPLLWIRRFRRFRRGLVLLELPLTGSGQRYYSRWPD